MNKVKLIFTLDYELPGNGTGDPYKLMVEPTGRLIDLMDKYGAKLTIMAEVAEIMQFKSYFEQTGEDKYSYLLIKEQLQNAVLRGHDVQLHVHSTYVNAKYDNGWCLDYSEYNIAELPFERSYVIIRDCKNFLDNLIREVKPSYSCKAYRSVGWTMMPTTNLYNALVKNGIAIDTSVYKWGINHSFKAKYDYSSAYSNVRPYRASNLDINDFDGNGKLIEFPIYSEPKSLFCFLTVQRAYRILHNYFYASKNKTSTSYNSNNNECSETKSNSRNFLVKKAWKLDYNQASANQMISTVRKICKSNSTSSVVLIGHSKTLNNFNEFTLKRFLKYASNNVHTTFGLFPD